MEGRHRHLIIAVATVSLSAFLSILTNLLTGGKPVFSWPIFGLLVLVIAVSAGILARQTARELASFEDGGTSILLKRNRGPLIASIRAKWIHGFLERAREDSQRIRLRMSEDPELVDSPVKTAASAIRRAYSSDDAVSAFDNAAGKLLIVGEPGAGKRILLLELVRDLLDRVERDEMQPVPVVFSLYSWQARWTLLEEWMKDELIRSYQVPEKRSAALIDHESIFPVLDGLDEVDGGIRGKMCGGSVVLFPP